MFFRGASILPADFSSLAAENRQRDAGATKTLLDRESGSKYLAKKVPVLAYQITLGLGNYCRRRGPLR
jgi:hypothetical protein